MFEYLESLDQKLFLLINSLNHPILDEIMWSASRKWHWLPVYLFLFYLVFKKYSWGLWKIVIGLAVLITLTDQISVNLFKDVFLRYRPCHNIDFQGIVHLVNNKCGGQYGFISSHAANYFGISSFLGLLLNRVYNKNAFAWMMLWAAFISYSRIYLGVHYPSDVFVGAILGLILGIGLFYIFKRFKILKELA